MRDSERQTAPARLLNTAEAAKYLSVSANTLRMWASMKKYLPLVRIGHLVRYDRLELDNFIEQNQTKIRD
ncbi:MAG: helix-turn-helix domain-containing protein [bacterium]